MALGHVRDLRIHHGGTEGTETHRGKTTKLLLFSLAVLRALRASVVNIAASI
jgi:hypothetical protein